MQIRCECIAADGSITALHDVLHFSLLRDRYLPCASLAIRLLTAAQQPVPVAVRLCLDGQPVHEGCVRKCTCILEKKQHIMQISSQGYSALLTQNQLVPGLYTQVTLQQLMETYALPHITYQDVPGIRYVYVRENANMWDTIVAYNYKLCRGYPYIRVPNLLCMMPQTGTEAVVLPADRLLRRGICGETGGIISRIDMANAVGEYGSYTMDNPEAAARGIVRVRQILFDRQYAYDPEDALRFRIAVSNRRLNGQVLRYIGYCGEDLEDLAVCGDFSARVSRILITGDSTGIVTEDTFYADPFCNCEALPAGLN